MFRLARQSRFVAAETRQGFLPIVTIPAGQTVSNRFTIFGISVGQTLLRITPLTLFVVSAFHSDGMSTVWRASIRSFWMPIIHKGRRDAALCQQLIRHSRHVVHRAGWRR